MPTISPLLPSSSLAGAGGIMLDLLSAVKVITSSLQDHLGHAIRHNELGLGRGHDVRHCNARGGFEEGGAATRKTNDGKFGYNEIHLAQRRDWQPALLEDLRFAFSGMLHGDNDALGPGDQVHRAA